MTDARGVGRLRIDVGSGFDDEPVVVEIRRRCTSDLMRATADTYEFDVPDGAVEVLVRLPARGLSAGAVVAVGPDPVHLSADLVDGEVLLASPEGRA